jgi:hypothetical protein
MGHEYTQTIDIIHYDKEDIEILYGDIEMWYLHREEGPAMIRIYNNVVINTEWWRNNRLHRIGGPAVIERYIQGDIRDLAYFIDHERFEFSDYLDMMKLIKDIRLDRNLAIMHIHHNNSYIREVCKDKLDET